MLTCGRDVGIVNTRQFLTSAYQNSSTKMPHLINEICDNDKSECLKKDAYFRDTFLMKLFILVTCIKILLIPTYHSTDFEVHRNWLAITHSLPIKEWYTNDKSQWTLDYPPFFAWFECFLSQIAAFVDPAMLKVENINYASNSTKLFQRATVILSDLVFVYGIREVGKTFCKSNQSFIMFSLLSICNIGLLIVDHVHFQYNGFLLGVLLLSLAKISSMDHITQGTAWFAILLNLKHLYLYVAPAFGIWVLRSYCLRSRFTIKFIKLGFTVIFFFALSFIPFYNQLPQVLSRLFPFKRGLVHAYWAANAWALYAATDKVLSVIWRKVGWLQNAKVASMTGGLVQEDSFAVLPTPTPLVTFMITFLFMIPALWNIFCDKEAYKHPKKFIRCVVLCGLTSFMFGWHVHEKAVLTAIIPLCILATSDVKDAKVFLLLSTAGHSALFPLLYPTELIPLKFILWFSYTIMTVILFKKQFDHSTVSTWEWFYIGGLPIITIYETVLHKMIFNDKLPFLPLAATSIYCAVGVVYSYILYYYEYLYGSVSSLKELKQKEIDEQERISALIMYELKKHS